MRKRYTSDFIESAVAEVHRGEQPLTAIAVARGVHPGVLSKWAKRSRAMESAKTDDSEALRKRIMLLEERVETLRGAMEKFCAHKYEHIGFGDKSTERKSFH